MKKVEFTPPDGAVPEGTAKGETFDLVCTFELNEEGKVCLTQMGEHDMPGYGKNKEPEGEKYRPGFDDMAQSISAGGPPGALSE